MDTGKPRKTCVEVAGRRTFRTLPSRQRSDYVDDWTEMCCTLEHLFILGLDSRILFRPEVIGVYCSVTLYKCTKCQLNSTRGKLSNQTGRCYILKSNVSQNTTNLLSNYERGDMFRLTESIIRSILKHVSLGTLSNRAHFWNPKMFKHCNQTN
jgi:hypothetical protein